MELVYVHDKSSVIKMNGIINDKDYGDSNRPVDEFNKHTFRYCI
jgi:hypothetical protein